MFKYFYDRRIIALKRRVKELEANLKDAKEKNTLSAIYSKKETLEQEGVFKLLLDNVNDIVVLFSSGNIIVYISPSCYTHLGYLPEEMEGKQSFSFVHPDDKALLTDLTNQFDYTKSNPIRLHRLIHKNGSAVWFESHWKPVFVEYNGQQTHVVIATKVLDPLKKDL